MTDPDDVEPEPLTQEEIDRAAVEAEDAADSFDTVGISDAEAEAADSDIWARDAETATRRRRLAPLQDRILAYLRDEGDEWQPWPEVVEAVWDRPLAEISPLNGRARQAALQLSKEDKVAIRYGQHTVYAAVRLLPAGYTDPD